MNNNLTDEYYQMIKNKISVSAFDSAIYNIDKLLSSYPKESQAYYYKGLCYFALEKYQDAISNYNNAILFDITNAKAYFNLAVTYYMLNNYDNALINFAKALILFSKFKELDCKKRCADALNFIEITRKSY